MPTEPSLHHRSLRHAALPESGNARRPELSIRLTEHLRTILWDEHSTRLLNASLARKTVGESREGEYDQENRSSNSQKRSKKHPVRRHHALRQECRRGSTLLNLVVCKEKSVDYEKRLENAAAAQRGSMLTIAANKIADGHVLDHAAPRGSTRPSESPVGWVDHILSGTRRVTRHPSLGRQ